jgi:hypothetical protein
MEMPAVTPTLDKRAITALQGAYARLPCTDQARAAFSFGWALEELVIRYRFPAASAAASPGLDPVFPPDLTHTRSPEAQLQNIRRRLFTLAPKVLAGAAASADALQATTPPLPDEIAQQITTLAAAFRANPTRQPDCTSLDALVAQWDAAIVDAIIDLDPAILTAYEVGKALNLTYCRLWLATAQSKAASDPSVLLAAWQQWFGTERLTKINQHLLTLDGVFDSRSVVIVAKSLGYWSGAVAQPDAILSAPPGGAAAGVPAARLGALLAALDEQRTYWYDILTERRSLESFPVAAIIASTTMDLGLSWSAGARRLAPVIAGVAVTITVVGLIIGILTVFVAHSTDNNAAATGLTGLGALISGAISVAIARGTVLFTAGAHAITQIQGRLTDLESEANGTAAVGASASGTGSPISWTAISQETLANVVAQIQLEEFALAVSEPLVTFVLGASSTITVAEDPWRRLKRFLQLIGATGNLGRLNGALRRLYNAPGTL